MKNGHKVLLLDLYEGIEVSDKNYENYFVQDKEYSYDVGEVNPDLAEVKRRNGNRKSQVR